MSRKISRLRRSRVARQVLYGRAGSGIPSFFIRDDFTTNDAAPITTPRTCEPGPGTLTFDGPDYYSIDGGKLIANSVPVNNLVRTANLTRVNGLAVAMKVMAQAVGSTRQTGLAWICGSSLYRFLYSYSGSSFYYMVSENSKNFSFPNVVSQYDLRWVLICRTDGYFYVHKIAAEDWKLCTAISGQGVGGTGSTVAARIDGPAAAAAELDEFKVFQMASPWNSQYGIADTHQASYTADTVLTMNADGLVECTWTPGAGETLNIQIRRTDDANHWLLECVQAASTIRVCEVNGGVNTQRSTATQTWVVGTAYHLQVRAETLAIRSAVNGASKNSYASASFNQTATGFKASLALTNLALYSITLIPIARLELERFINV